jgi:hypothetical protein
VVALSPLFRHLPRKSGGGVRGDIKSWSAASRRRLLFFMAALPLDAITRETGGDWAFVTLTYPTDPGPEEMRRHRNAFLMAMRRSGIKSWVWKLEFQERGAPHMHLLVQLRNGSRKELQRYRLWLWETWERTIGVRGRVDADWCRARDVARYIAFDQTKWTKAYQYRVPESWLMVGRWWGYSGVRPRWRGRALTERELIAARRFLRRHRVANANYKCKFGRGRSANGKMWALGMSEGSLAADIERYLASVPAV